MSQPVNRAPCAAGPAEPRHADAAAVLGLADDLMAEHAWRVLHRNVAVQDVQVGAAQATGLDLQQQLARAGLGNLALRES